MRRVGNGDFFLLKACRLLAHDAGWNEIVTPCALSRNPEIYDDLAEQMEILCSPDAIFVEAHCIVNRTGLKTCRISQTLGGVRQDVDDAGDRSPVIGVLMALCKRSSYPAGIGWCSLDVSYDMAGGRMKACMHYGFDEPLHASRLYSRDLMMEPVAPVEIARFVRSSLHV